jgi:hypothetical protein
LPFHSSSSLKHVSLEHGATLQCELQDRGKRTVDATNRRQIPILQIKHIPIICAKTQVRQRRAVVLVLPVCVRPHGVVELVDIDARMVLALAFAAVEHVGVVVECFEVAPGYGGGFAVLLEDHALGVPPVGILLPCVFGQWETVGMEG